MPPTSPDITALNWADRHRAGSMLARSFYNDPMLSAYWPDEDRRKRYFPWYMTSVVTYGLIYGRVFQTTNIAGVIIWLPPGQTEFTLWRYIRAGFFALPYRAGQKQSQITGINDEFMAKTHKELMPGPHWYCWALGVDPAEQGKGISSTLMRHGCGLAAAEGLPCYLETHNQRNVPIYEHMGFKVLRQSRPATHAGFNDVVTAENGLKQGCAVQAVLKCS